MLGSLTRLTILIGCMASGALAQVQSLEITGREVSHTALKAVHHGDHVRIEKFAIPDGIVDLELDRVDVLTDDARLELGTSDGIVDLDRPDVVILSGIVAGRADSQAYIAVSPYGTNGFIKLDGELFSISTGPYAQGRNLEEALRSVRMEDAIDPNAAPPPACGYTQGDERLEPFGEPIERKATSARGGGTICRIATVAVDTDWEFNDRLFNGNSNAAAAYLVSLMGAISEIYERDVDVRLAVPFLRVWDDDSDPYSVAAGDPLDQVRAHWNSQMDDVDRTITHYFTGRQDTSYGGVAYVGVLCFNEYGYGVSAYLDGSFPYPLIDYSYGNWDVVVAAHEMGHNFGTGHTHSYNPPIDGCGNGDCSDPFGGTIMSYCHTCSGGLSNIQLNFHERVRNNIMAYLDDVNCDLISQGVTAINDTAFALENVQMEIDALGNDNAQSCDPFVIQNYDSTSAEGGTVELLAGEGPHGLGLFSYTPPIDYSGPDEFSYAIVSDDGVHDAVVSIDVRGLRAADTRINPIPGLRLSYYQLNAPEVLPDFDTLDPIGEEVSENIAYPSTNGEFINSGLADEVGAVFEGFVFAHMNGEYTFSTESDDGSQLYIGEELVVDNDGLHGMVKRSGSIPLSAGWHKVSIEFFENGGGAGLFATMAGPEMVEQNLMDFLLSHESTLPCSPADINADQVVDFFDISQFLQYFNDGDLAADFDDDGRLTFFDLSSFLQAFGAGCP